MTRAALLGIFFFPEVIANIWVLIGILAAVLLGAYAWSRHCRSAGRSARLKTRPILLLIAPRQRAAYRYGAVGVFYAPLLAMGFEDDLPANAVRHVTNTAVLVLLAMILFPPPGGLVTIFDRDGNRS